MKPGDSTRREFFKTIALSGVSFVLVSPEAGADESFGDFFSLQERKALASLADGVLPGAAKLGAVTYIETLLTAFDSDPPRIYASGPFSGRTPFPTPEGSPSPDFPPNRFAEFLPLNRTQ